MHAPHLKVLRKGTLQNNSKLEKKAVEDKLLSFSNIYISIQFYQFS